VTRKADHHRDAVTPEFTTRCIPTRISSSTRYSTIFAPIRNNWVGIVTGPATRRSARQRPENGRAAGENAAGTKAFCRPHLALRLRQPIIAAGHGVAMAAIRDRAGLRLIIASENARFALPERMSASQRSQAVCAIAAPDRADTRDGHDPDGGVTSLPGKFRTGFVNEVVAARRSIGGGGALGRTICKNSPMSIRASKQAIQLGMAVSWNRRSPSRRDYPAVKAMAASQDTSREPKAFSEKRPPGNGWGVSSPQTQRRHPRATATRFAGGARLLQGDFEGCGHKTVRAAILRDAR